MRHRFGHRGGRQMDTEDFGNRRRGGGYEHAHGHSHGGGRGRRRKAMFDQAELQTLLLSLIGEQPRHGYELIGAVSALSNEAYSPSPGMIYPALTYMEESGLIAIVDEGSARKSYRLTSEGEQRAESERDQSAALRAKLEAIASAQERTDPAPVRRAMQNLKSAVLGRLSQEDVSQELLFQIVDAIDDAARNIERMDR